MIEKCNAAQIEELRSIFLEVYGFDNIYDFFKEDLPQLNELKDRLVLLKNSSNFDAIQKLQLKYFILNIEKIISKLDNH